MLRVVDVTLEGGEGDAPPTVAERSAAHGPGRPRAQPRRRPRAGRRHRVRAERRLRLLLRLDGDGRHHHGTRTRDGTFRAVLHVPHLPLLGGGYYLNVGTIDNRSALLMYDVQERRCPFRVRNPSDEFGVMRMDHAWLAEDASVKGVAR